MVGNRGASVGALIVTVLAFGGGAAFAQDAKVLLKRGIAAMKTGDYEAACPVLAESFKLEPNATSAFESATCEAHAGRFKTATARYGHYLELVREMSDRDRKKHKDGVQTARDQRAELIPLIPTVTLTLSAGAPTDTIVQCDGALIEASQLGAPVQLDPGEHVFTTQAPSGSVRERRVTLTASDKIAVMLVVDLPGSQAPVAPPKPTAAPEPDRPTPPPPVESSGLRRPLAYGALALGILGAAAGAVTGILSLQKKGAVDDNCDSGTCNAEGKSAADSGLLLAHLSTIGFGVGVAGIATGVVLIVTEPSAAAPPAPSTAWRGMSVGLAGRW